MKKKLKIQFWKAEKALAMQILVQEGLPQLLTSSDSVFLRGSDNLSDFKIAQIMFSTNAERDAYLKKAVNAITDELFTGERELKVGEICEVKDYKDEQWKKRKLLAILPEQYNERFITETEDYPTEYSSWDCARPIVKSTEPTIEECGQLITYTWEEK